MRPFKSKEEKERIRQEKLDAELNDIVSVGSCNTNGYFRHCAKCNHNFSYWYCNISYKVCPKCGYTNWAIGELMVTTESNECPSKHVAQMWLRLRKYG